MLIFVIYGTYMWKLNFQHAKQDIKIRVLKYVKNSF